MKKSMIKLLSPGFLAPAVLIAVIFAVAACNKQPAADFTTDKTEYTAGETVKCSNRSVGASSYKWTFPDGQTSAAENPEYVISQNAVPGVYIIKLEAISRRGNKSSEATKAFTIKAATGQLLVWTSNSSVGQIDVRIDDTPHGTITHHYASNPGCGANGCVTANLSVGSHTVSAYSGLLTWNGTINVLRDQCSTFEIK